MLGDNSSSYAVAFGIVVGIAIIVYQESKLKIKDLETEEEAGGCLLAIAIVLSWAVIIGGSILLSNLIF